MEEFEGHSRISTNCHKQIGSLSVTVTRRDVRGAKEVNL